MKIIFTVFFVVFSLFACSNPQKAIEENRQGHIIFTYEGEQDRPVSPYTIICKGDTSHLKYKRESEKDIFYHFIMTAGYHPSNIDTVSYIVFEEMKDILSTYSLNNDTVPTGEDGSLYLFIGDSIKTNTLSMPGGDSTASYLNKLIHLADEANKKNVSRRLTNYKNMQKHQNKSN